MKTLLILRHAKSSWKDETLPDHERPLNKRGKQSAPLMGELIRREGLLPDFVLCSTAKRARQTADLVAEASDYQGEIEYLRELYAAPPQAYLQALSKLDDRYERVMVVGHNPGLEELLQALTGEMQPLPTAALAQVELPIQQWAEVKSVRRGKLVEIWRPKELG